MSQKDLPWNEMFEKLRQHKEETGSCNVAKSSDPILAAWVRSQRSQYRQLHKCKEEKPVDQAGYPCDHQHTELTTERAVQLEDLGFEWDSRAENEAMWKMRLKELEDYKAKHKDCLVPARYSVNAQLGHWVMTQRRQYCLLKQGRASTLTKERIESLEQVGFVWTSREDPSELWNQRLNELKEYKHRHGDCLVPQRYAENLQLGTWVNTQRRHYKLFQEGKRSSMTPKRIAELEAIGFCWKSPKLNSLRLKRQLRAMDEYLKQQNSQFPHEMERSRKAVRDTCHYVGRDLPPPVKRVRTDYTMLQGTNASHMVAGMNAAEYRRLHYDRYEQHFPKKAATHAIAYKQEMRSLQFHGQQGHTSKLIDEQRNRKFLDQQRHERAMTEALRQRVLGGGGWLCGICRVARFFSFEEACRHEVCCARQRAYDGLRAVR